MCRYLLDDRGVEAVKAAVQPDALREEAAESQSIHTPSTKQVQARLAEMCFSRAKTSPGGDGFQTSTLEEISLKRIDLKTTGLKIRLYPKDAAISRHKQLISVTQQSRDLLLLIYNKLR